MSRLQLITSLHQRLADYVRPQGSAVGTETYELAGRFATLFALASILLPFFVLEFIVLDFVPAALVLTAMGAVMLSSFMVYRMLSDIAAAREVFVGALFCFLVWENFFFGTVYSPALAWFAVLPVVSILLGSVRSGIAWLLASLCALILHFFWMPPVQLALLWQREFATLFLVSVSGMILANFLFVVLVDSARKQAINKLAAANDAHRDLSERDELTGLFNRRALQRRLRQVLRDCSPKTVVVLIADLDGFKDVNDTYGHDAGDRVIVHVADRLLRLCSEHDAILARLGGDEFAIVLVSSSPVQAAENFVRSTLGLITDPVEVEAKVMLLGMSLGAAFAVMGSDATEVMRRADLAMYEAKNQGGNRLCCYSESIDTARASRLDKAIELADAISRGHIEVHYQPIVDAATGSPTGVEALARWTLDGERIPPDVFIPIAEESGLAHKLGLFVLETACRDAASWGTAKVSVNLSPVEFRSPDLVSDILAVLSKTEFSADRLELEVTEGYLIQHRDRALPIINALRAAGISIALDDFGSGYSSIGYLRQYPFDRLKIDKSIVQAINGDASSKGVVLATVLLATSLSLRVTAEGVETEEQAMLLRLAGCTSLQGFFFGRPAPSHEIDLLLAREPGQRSTVLAATASS